MFALKFVDTGYVFKIDGNEGFIWTDSLDAALKFHSFQQALDAVLARTRRYPENVSVTIVRVVPVATPQYREEEIK